MAEQKKKQLTRQQVMFCNYYLETGNAYQSALKAGYSEQTADKKSYALLQKPEIQEYLEKQRAKMDKTNIMTIEQIQEFWTNVITNGKYDIKDRLKATELLGKSLGSFIDRVESKNHNTNEVVFIDDISQENVEEEVENEQDSENE